MELIEEGFWGILLNITGICLWGGTVLYLVIKKVKGRRKDLTICRIRNQRNFEEEVFSQLVKQQSEKAFKRISRTINNERQLLAELIENGDLKKAGTHLKSKRISKIKPKSLADSNMKKPFPENTERDSYAEVLRLADQGMTVRKISEIVKIPKGEIEMLITLRKRKRKVARRRAAG
jgi:hypothetical protein